MSGFFKLQLSYAFSAILFFGYSLAFLIVFMLPIIVLVKILFVFLLASALLHYLRRDAWLLLPSSPLAIRIEGKDITLLTRGGNEFRGMISASSVVTPVITILNVFSQVKKGAAPRYVIIFPDSMDKEQFRELRVLLRWGARS